jgi:hypothetical protein
MWSVSLLWCRDHAEASGSYLALPLTGHKGEVIGVLGLDTLTTPMSARR